MMLLRRNAVLRWNKGNWYHLPLFLKLHSADRKVFPGISLSERLCQYECRCSFAASAWQLVLHTHHKYHAG